MTRIDEVLRQIEAVIDDTDIPATFGEMIAMRRILTRITRQYHNRQGTILRLAEPTTDGVFPGRVYTCLRAYERQQNIHIRTRRIQTLPYHRQANEGVAV